MKKLIFLLLIVCIACNQERNNLISYKVSPIEKDGKPALNILMEFDANPSGETVVILQDKAWGEENLHNTLSDLQSKQVNEIIKEKDSQRFVLKHDPSLKKIQFSYTIQQDTEGKLTTRSTYRPVIQDQFFHIFSHNFFMLPRDYVPNSSTPFDVQIDWSDFNEDYHLVNSFDTNNQMQTIENTNERYFHSAVFTGGDYRSYELDIEGNKAVFGIRGDWNAFQDSTIVQMLKQTLQVQRDFWQDHSQKYFAVTLTPTYRENGSSFQGSGLTNSFATSASNNEYLEFEGLIYLFNHELQHNWTGHLIKNDNEEEQYWFSEGFTEYYTLKNIAKNNIGGLNAEYFIEQFNEFITSLYQSPVKEAPNSEINYENFWSSYDYSKLPYRRGAIFAFYLDHLIQQDPKGEKSLDDLMLAIKEDALHKEQRLSHDYFLSKANEYLNDDLQPFFDKHIIKGELYDLKDIFAQFGYDFNPTTSIYDLGFSFTEDRKFVAEIDIKSNAYKAGLRKGDRISKRKYAIDPTYKAEFTIKKNNAEKIVRFYPATAAEIPTLTQSDSNKKALSFRPN
jgi:predicted metalloprotease with PDZ domain